MAEPPASATCGDFVSFCASLLQLHPQLQLLPPLGRRKRRRRLRPKPLICAAPVTGVQKLPAATIRSPHNNALTIILLVTALVFGVAFVLHVHYVTAAKPTALQSKAQSQHQYHHQHQHQQQLLLLLQIEHNQLDSTSQTDRENLDQDEEGEEDGDEARESECSSRSSDAAIVCATNVELKGLQRAAHLLARFVDKTTLTSFKLHDPLSSIAKVVVAPSSTRYTRTSTNCASLQRAQPKLLANSKARSANQNGNSRCRKHLPHQSNNNNIDKNNNNNNAKVAVNNQIAPQAEKVHYNWRPQESHKTAAADATSSSSVKQRSHYAIPKAEPNKHRRRLARKQLKKQHSQARLEELKQLELPLAAGVSFQPRAPLAPKLGQPRDLPQLQSQLQLQSPWQSSPSSSLTEAVAGEAKEEQASINKRPTRTNDTFLNSGSSKRQSRRQTQNSSNSNSSFALLKPQQVHYAQASVSSKQLQRVATPQTLSPEARYSDLVASLRKLAEEESPYTKKTKVTRELHTGESFVSHLLRRIFGSFAHQPMRNGATAAATSISAAIPTTQPTPTATSAAANCSSAQNQSQACIGSGGGVGTGVELLQAAVPLSPSPPPLLLQQIHTVGGFDATRLQALSRADDYDLGANGAQYGYAANYSQASSALSNVAAADADADHHHHHHNSNLHSIHNQTVSAQSQQSTNYLNLNLKSPTQPSTTKAIPTAATSLSLAETAADQFSAIIQSLESTISLPKLFNYSITTLLTLIIVVTFVGNILVCLSVIRVRKLRHPSNYLLISLAISDLCVAVFVMPFGMYYSLNDNWKLGKALCNVYVSFDITSCTASILNLCVISIDRYLAITRPLTYGVKRTTRLMLGLIALIWVLACFISVPPLLISGNEYGTVDEPRCEPNQHLWYQLYATCISFYIPLIVMLCLYYNIYTAAKKVVEDEQRATIGLRVNSFNNNTSRSTYNNNNTTTSSLNKFSFNPTPPPPLLADANNNTTPADNNNNNGNSLQLPSLTANHDSSSRRSPQSTGRQSISGTRSSSAMRERKASITLGVIMGAFTICWLPFFILALLRPFSETVNNLPRTFVLLTLWLGYANSLLNPIIYVTFHRDFRSAFKHLLCFQCMSINEQMRKDEYKFQYGT